MVSPVTLALSLLGVIASAKPESSLPIKGGHGGCAMTHPENFTGQREHVSPSCSGLQCPHCQQTLRTLAPGFLSGRPG